MASLPEVAEFTAGVYQIETSDPVVGGVDGVNNLGAKALANRTLWLKGQVEALQAALGSAGMPVGSVIWRAANAAPAGFLICNGATVSRATYAALFGVIGTVFGAGDGATSFALPDLRGVFVRGFDAGRGLDPSRLFGSLQQDQANGVSSFQYLFKSGGVVSGNIPEDGTPIDVRTAGHQYDATPVSSVRLATSGVETRPKNVALLPLIRF